MAWNFHKLWSARRRRPTPHGPAAPRFRNQRRGTVLIMVVGVLAMLFIIGATQLLVARFERDAAQQKRAADNLQGVATSMALPALAQLRQDVVGNDGVPYNAANQIHNANNPPVEDYADFAGKAGNVFRHGDLLLASLEPYYDPTVQVYRWFASSWAMDAAAGELTPPDNNEVGALPYSPTSADENYGDADADGILDSRALGIGASAPFGGTYNLFQKIVPHSGMVLMDRMTHPALLAQVIHPSDSGYHDRPWTLFQGGSIWSRTDDDESELRRRGLLPDSVTWGSDEWQALASNNLRKLLPYTLGYRSSVSGYNSVTPHWWPVDNTRDDVLWWQKRMVPNQALTEGLNPNNDIYDRRHLITTRGGDDVLRRQRDEQGGSTGGGGTPTPGMFVADATTAAEAPLRQLYYVVAPEASGGTDSLGFEKTPAMAYGRPVDIGNGALGDLMFNKPGQRTAFSLRDVLVDGSSNSVAWNGGYQASYRRAVQLTAYYLAMLQHTDGWPNVTPDPRVVQAAQLAVNTIDFADNGNTDNNLSTPDVMDPITRFQLPLADGTTVDVCGVERQPYITEAYAKIVHEPDPATFPLNPQWKATPSPESLYAVELYNPYDTDLSLNDYAIEVGVGASPTPYSLAGMNITIPAYGYIVIADQTNDDNLPTPMNPFIDRADDGTGGGGHQNLFTIPGFEIPAGAPVSLVRTQTALLQPGGGASLGPSVVVDRIEPVPGGFGGSNWAKADVTLRPPNDDTVDRLVRDTSLQRRKEWKYASGSSMPTAQFPPQYWHFTLSKPILFPLPWNEDPNNSAALRSDQGRFAQHNLLAAGTPLAAAPYTCDASIGVGVTNQALVAAYFDGREVALDNDPSGRLADANTPIAPFPVIVSDRGLDLTSSATLGCAAFPTTGTLLLVTRNGPTSYNGVPDATRPLTYSAVEGYNGGPKPDLTLIDQGHMPVFNYSPDQGMGKTLDLTEGRGRLDVPWGQLVFDYFTALPLEELVFLSSANYENDYVTRFGTQISGDWISLYPMVDLTEAGVPMGAKVRGRVNINTAPWWVLDGLPVLPDAVPGSTSAALWAASPAVPSGSRLPTAALPVSELLSGRLDPVDLASITTERAGAYFIDALFDNTTTDGLTNEDFPTVGPDLARYMVGYREGRDMPSPSTVLTDGTGYLKNVNGGAPGFVSLGGLCNLIPAIRPPNGIVHYDGVTNVPVAAPSFGELRQWFDPTATNANTTPRPFSYLGYLQMIAPIVRLQDWATVKGHVFTIYSVIGNNGDPEVWLRSQTTVDRTRCLYSNDLPDRILQTDVLGFYNAVTDQ